MNTLKGMVRALVTGGLLVAVLPFGQAMAQDAKTYRDSIKQYQIRADQLKSESTARYNSEMSQISSWIDESLILIGKDEGDKVKATLPRSELAAMQTPQVFESTIIKTALTKARPAPVRITSR